MASPQVENGYTRIANELMEVIPLYKFNGTQFRILFVVLRYTYGFQRKSHDLSLTFIAENTGIHKQQIKRELDMLIKNKVLIEEEPPSFNKSRIIQFNKNYKEWLISRQSAKTLTVNKKDDHTVSENAYPTVSELAYQERNNKENIKENIIVLSPIENEILETLSMVKHYPIDREKDLDMIKRLEERYPELDILESIKDWAAYKLDKPLKSKDNPRSQINTACKNYIKWGKNLKGEEDGTSKKHSGKTSKYSEEQLKKFRAF